MKYPAYMNARQRHRCRRIDRELVHVHPKHAKDLGAAAMMDRAVRMMNLELSDEDVAELLLGPTSPVATAPTPR